MQRREALQRRAEKERNELSQLHLITSPEELTLALAEIDKTNISAPKKKAKKLDLLKTQVRISYIKELMSHLPSVEGNAHSMK